MCPFSNSSKLSAFGISHQTRAFNLVYLASKTSSQAILSSIGCSNLFGGQIVAKVNVTRKHIVFICVCFRGNNGNISTSGILLTSALYKLVIGSKRIGYIVNITKNISRGFWKTGKRNRTSGFINSRNGRLNLVVSLRLGINISRVCLCFKCTINGFNLAINGGYIALKTCNLGGVLTNSFLQPSNSGSIRGVPLNSAICFLSGLLIGDSSIKTNNANYTSVRNSNRLAITNWDSASFFKGLVRLNNIEVGRIFSYNNNLLTEIINRISGARGFSSLSSSLCFSKSAKISVVLKRKGCGHRKRNTKIKFGQIRNSHNLYPPFLP